MCAPNPKTSFPRLLERPLTLLQGAHSALTDGHQAITEASGGFRMGIIWCPRYESGFLRKTHALQTECVPGKGSATEVSMAQPPKSLSSSGLGHLYTLQRVLMSNDEDVLCIQ